MEILAARDTVVCQNPPDSKTKSGIVVPSGNEKRPESGIVIAIGEAGKDGTPIKMKVGDKIVFRRYSDNRIYIEGKEYNFIHFKDIVGVIND